MEVAVSSRRVLRNISLILFGLVIGCSSNTSRPTVEGSDDAKPVANNSIGDSSSKDLATTSNPETVAEQLDFSRVLLDSASGNDIGLEVGQGKGFSTVTIKTNGQAPDIQVSELQSPSRLVIDLPKFPISANQNFELSGYDYISGVRIGAHPDKGRVVIDLAKSGLDHQVDVIDNNLLVTLRDKNSSPQIAAQDIYAEAPRADLGLATDDSRPAPEPVKPTVTALRLERSADGNDMIVADLTSGGYYDIKKTAPTEYVVRLENTAIDPAALVTLLAPPSGGDIRSVRPVKEGSDVLLRIFSKVGSELQAKSSNGKLTILPSSADDSSPFAQMKPEVAANKDKAAPKEEVSDKNIAGDKNTEVSESDVTAAPGGEGVQEDASLESLLGADKKYTGRLISLDLQDTDIDNALRIIAEVSNLNIIASDDVTGKVTLRLIDVPWDQALDVILKTNGLDKVQEGNVIRVAPVEKLRQEREALKEAQKAEEELEPLVVRYVRISYAQASEIQPTVESVLTERGAVVTDQRTNQLIIKDIKKGVGNAVELVKKLDLRTPQVLLETQIVESTRNFLRDLGTELGFDYIQSPETGNATGYNFPNAVSLGGSFDSTGTASAFPASLEKSSGSAVSALLTSADGTKTLNVRISALERDGRLRIVSRPSVATVNNKPAVIKSVEKFRVRLPSGGTSIATGSQASAGGSSSATETIETGITLEVTPQASPDYYVLLDIKAKSSTADFTRAVDDIPAEDERLATSTVLVSSGQTFAIGGIYKITDNDSVSGVPFLKDVPVFGTFFRNSKVEDTDEELIFFVTPRIVEGSFDDAAMRSGL